MSDWRDSPTLTMLNSMSYGHVPMAGMGKSGKTMNAHSIIEACPDLRDRPKAFYSLPDVSIFPADYQAYSVTDFDDVEPGSIAFLDDVARLFPSRNSRDLTLQMFIGLISHKDILIFSTVQSFQNADQCFYRDQVIIPLMKVFSYFGTSFERIEFADFCKAANRLIPEFSRATGVDDHLLVFSPLYSELLALRPPSWYGRAHSHSLRDVRILDGVRKNG